MNDASALRSGKGHRDENFPVASWLIDPRHRGPILAFYNFVRTADDIADHATLPPEEKLALLDRLDAGLTGTGRQRCGRGAAARGAGRAQSVAEARAGSARRVQARRHQAALSRLGRSDRLLLAVGDAGRPLRARRPRREPRLLAGQRCAVRGVADHQSSAGLQGGLPQSRPRLCSARCARGVRARMSRRSARRARRRRCSIACTGLPSAPSGC